MNNSECSVCLNWWCFDIVTIICILKTVLLFRTVHKLKKLSLPLRVAITPGWLYSVDSTVNCWYCRISVTRISQGRKKIYIQNMSPKWTKFICRSIGNALTQVCWWPTGFIYGCVATAHCPLCVKCEWQSRSQRCIGRRLPLSAQRSSRGSRSCIIIHIGKGEHLELSKEYTV